jgi:hypothetical protein
LHPCNVVKNILQVGVRVLKRQEWPPTLRARKLPS